MTEETKRKISATKSIPMKDRIMKHVKICPVSKCWIWTGARKGHGYGNIRANGRNFRAHRAMYEIVKGPIPFGMNLLHQCDTRLCVNPDHMKIGTQSENVREMIERGRSAYRRNFHLPEITKQEPITADVEF